MASNEANPITIGDSSGEEESGVIDLTVDAQEDAQEDAETDPMKYWLAAAKAICIDLRPIPGFRNHPDADEESDKELTKKIDAFVEVIEQAQDALDDPNTARPQLDELLRGPRAELYRWLKAQGREEDARRVSRKGLGRGYKAWKDYVEENGWPDDGREEETLLSLI